MPSTFPADELAEEFFQRNIRVTQILALIGLVHHDSLDDAWEDFLNNPYTEFDAIIKERFGIIGEKYENESDLARAIMLKNDNGFIVCYDIPVIQSIHGEGENESYSTYGFGHCARHCLYMEKLDADGLNLVLDHAEASSEAMKVKLRAGNKKNKSKASAKS